MTVLGLILIGLAAGAMASALGVGGGIVFVPALVVVFGFTQQLAQGTSLAVILGTSIIGTWAHHQRDRVDWITAAAIGIAGIAGAVAGSTLAVDLDPLLLRRLFAGLLLVVAARLSLHARRTR